MLSASPPLPLLPSGKSSGPLPTHDMDFSMVPSILMCVYVCSLSQLLKKIYLIRVSTSNHVFVNDRSLE